MGVTDAQDAAQAQEDAVHDGGGGGGGGGAGEEGGDPRRLLEVCASLAGQDAAGIQAKLNTYVSWACGARLVFLILVSEEEELSVHVLGRHTLPCPLKIPVSNNSFSRALTTRRPMTLKDIEPSHREDLWRLLGLLQDSDRLAGHRTVSVDATAGGDHRPCLKTNGSAKSVDDTSSRFKVLSRDMSVDMSRSGRGEGGRWGIGGSPLNMSAAAHKYHRCSLPAPPPHAHRTHMGSCDSLEEESAIPVCPRPPLQGLGCKAAASSMPPIESSHNHSAKPQLNSRATSRPSRDPSESSSVPPSPTSLLCVPVTAPGKDTTAVLVCLVDKVAGGDFSNTDVHKVEECFRYTVGMLVNTTTAERERRLRTQCQALLNVAQNLFTHLDDVTVLLREIMAEARQLTDAERCSLFLLDREQNQLVAKVFDGESKEESCGEVRLPATQGIAGHVATTGHLLNIRDAYAHPLFYRGFDECTGFKTRNILCFPIKEDGQVIGVAELCNKTTGLHFSRFDEEIATAFSIYCGISIANSLLYKKVFDTQVRSKLSNELMMFHMKVTQEEVDRLVQAEVLPPEAFHKDFCSFKYFPRQVADACTAMAVISMMERLGMVNKFRLSRESLARFTLMVRKGYRDPPYHNWLHAFSVTHFAFLLLHNLCLTENGSLTHLEALALIVSSMCHDLDHRGTTNSFQVASNSVLASLYSSEGSVMERHHLAQAMCILNTDDCNFLENLSREEYTLFLDLMRDIILATDLAHHLRIVPELREIAAVGYDPSNQRHHELLICLLMTAADLSDQTKDWQSSKHVAELIYKEFFTQGDLEKAMGNMPLEMMDREKAFIPELQLQFLDDVAIPVYEIVAKLFPGAQEPYISIQASRRNWARLRDVYKRRKPESTSSLEVFEDDSLDEELEKEDS
nr:cGMP-dependent 3',5'-cyclic phosphodiesterase-like isoform X2 [Procambarus clarkii]XP_045599471.1 cGMP-dependent 3',5'-cyclic phosphodiesterase-like isoform X2 [Procambarus clarkii]XP_045599472.1 cGMP-dependent 3',5'-cyclic phosphodiesterase-like isoform X2 [Procambarus clarkii]